MISLEQGIVLEVLADRPGMRELLVLVAGHKEKAIQYENGPNAASPGQKVLLNTTAVRLGLGTGGYHFVVPASDTVSIPVDCSRDTGHLMKLRYTPGQFSVLSCEEPQHPAHKLLEGQDSLQGMPVIAAELHSMLPAIAATVHYVWEQRLNSKQIPAAGSPRIAYVMTDGGALPLALSKNVAELKQKNLLAGTVTVGNAYGGDLEAVTVYSGLLAAKYVLQADLAIVTMGPGVAGTGTQFGHTGIEQGQIINAVGSLEGTPIACPRISFSDKRVRHQGISHHTLTALSKVALTAALVPFPLLQLCQMKMLFDQLRRSALHNKHKLCFRDGSQVKEAAARYQLKLTTMGRDFAADPAFFLAAGAASTAVVDILNKTPFTSSVDLDTVFADRPAT